MNITHLKKIITNYETLLPFNNSIDKRVVLFLYTELYKTNQVIMDISATEFKLQIESVDGILLDVRTPEEISGGYIENSIM